MKPIPDSLIDLLPAIYRSLDQHGDLSDFLSLPVPVLRDLEEKISHFSELHHLESLDPRFLPLLASMLADPLRPGQPVEEQRRHIREAIPRYRRLGTLPALERDLREIGWSGELRETFRAVNRLNRRGLTNNGRLAGRIHSLAVLRVKSDHQTHGMRDVIEIHQPAGTVAFYWQWLASRSEPVPVTNDSKAFYFQFSFQDLTGIFSLQRNRLNRDRHLSVRHDHDSIRRVRIGEESTCLPENSVTWIGRWVKLMPGCIKTNQSCLNNSAFTNLWTNDQKQITEARIILETSGLADTPKRLNQGKRLPFAEPDQRTIVRKCLFNTLIHSPSVAYATRVSTFVSVSDPAQRFLISRQPLNLSSLGPSPRPASSRLSVEVAITAETGVLLAESLVDRRFAQTERFSINRGQLNAVPVSRVPTGDQVAQFNQKSDVSNRAATITVNQTRLNQVAAKLTYRETPPTQTNQSRLNKTKIRSVEQGLAWLINQKTQVSLQEVDPTNTVLVRATRWPVVESANPNPSR